MPAANSVHVSRDLTNISIATGRGEYIADTVAPRIQVQKKADVFYIWDALKESSRVEDSLRAEGTAANFVDAQWTTDNYKTADHAFYSRITDEMRSNADVAIEPEVNATETAKRKLLVQQDVDLKAILDASGADSNVPAVKWDANGNAVEDVLDAKQRMADNDQVDGNALAMSKKVLWKLLTNDVIIERIKAGGSNDNPAVVGLRALAQVFEVERIAVALAYKNTASLGDTAVMVDVWDDDVYLLHTPPMPGMKVIAGVVTFTWDDPQEGNVSEGHFVRKFRDDFTKSDIIAVHKNYDQKVISSGSIQILDDVLT